MNQRTCSRIHSAFPVGALPWCEDVAHTSQYHPCWENNHAVNSCTAFLNWISWEISYELRCQLTWLVVIAICTFLGMLIFKVLYAQMDEVRPAPDFSSAPLCDFGHPCGPDWIHDASSAAKWTSSCGKLFLCYFMCQEMRQWSVAMRYQGVVTIGKQKERDGLLEVRREDKSSRGQIFSKSFSPVTVHHQQAWNWSL